MPGEGKDRRARGDEPEEYEERLEPGEPEALGAEDTAGPPPLDQVDKDVERDSQPVYTAGHRKVGPDKDADVAPNAGSAGRAGPRRMGRRPEPEAGGEAEEEE